MGVFKCSHIHGSFKRWEKEKLKKPKETKKTKRKEYNFQFQNNWIMRKHRIGSFQYLSPALWVMNQMTIFQMQMLLCSSYFTSYIKNWGHGQYSFFVKGYLKDTFKLLYSMLSISICILFTFNICDTIMSQNLSCLKL